ncbi:MAG: ATP-binding protein [Pseudomonadota bacterium]|nr:ATP-binding protein [Pseudomonadota bacterium]
MVNLISNAAQSSASEIAIKTERKGSHARITISDNGVGIAPGEIEHVSIRFIPRGARRTFRGWV